MWMVWELRRTKELWVRASNSAGYQPCSRGLPPCWGQNPPNNFEHQENHFLDTPSRLFTTPIRIFGLTPLLRSKTCNICWLPFILYQFFQGDAQCKFSQIFLPKSHFALWGKSDIIKKRDSRQKITGIIANWLTYCIWLTFQTQYNNAYVNLAILMNKDRLNHLHIHITNIHHYRPLL